MVIVITVVHRNALGGKVFGTIYKAKVIIEIDKAGREQLEIILPHFKGGEPRHEEIM